MWLTLFVFFEKNYTRASGWTLVTELLIIQSLGEAGKLAKPKMAELFDAIRAKAREAGGEAASLKKEIAALIEQAQSTRAGKSGYGAKAKELAGIGKSPQAQQEEALREAEKAAGEAKLYAAANAAQLDSRAEKAQQYAEQAKIKRVNTKLLHFNLLYRIKTLHFNLPCRIKTPYEKHCCRKYQYLTRK